MDRIDVTRFVIPAESRQAVMLDVRSPAEFRDGHIPGAFNLPLLDDDERRQVGITYKENGTNAAVELGFRLVGHKLADYAARARQISSGGPVKLYCWRGGMRSQVMAWLLDLSGIHTEVLDGGYKAWRNWCLGWFRNPGPLVVLSGMTGAGKTSVLLCMRQLGQSVLDLEGLASHRGSAFGGLGRDPQPSQEQFENMLALEIASLQNPRGIWVEDESRFIGQLRIPDDFFIHMNKCPDYEIVCSREKRINRIVEDYGQFSVSELVARTQLLVKRFGGEQVKGAVELLTSGEIRGWVSALLGYYDKTYSHSRMRKKMETTPQELHEVLVGDGASDQEVARTIIKLFDKG